MTITKTIHLSEDNIKEILETYFQIPKDQIELTAETISVGPEMYPTKKIIISADLTYFSNVDISN